MDSQFLFISESPQGIILNVKLVPNSSYNKIVDYTSDYLRIKISSPPIDNRANKELISYCSSLLCINKSKIEIISGEKSKLKRILLKNAEKDKVMKKIMFVLDSISKER